MAPATGTAPVDAAARTALLATVPAPRSASAPRAATRTLGTGIPRAGVVPAAGPRTGAHRALTPSGAADPATWVAALYAAALLTQRLSVPGTSVALVLPLVLLWGVAALRRGVVELSRERTLLWLAAFGVCGLLLLVQVLGGFARHTSVGSFLLFAVTWSPLVLAMRDRTRAAFVRTAERCVRVGLGLAGLSLAFIGLQLVGVRYVDVVADLVPSSALIPGYVTTYPLSFGSAVMRSNAWIGLEASVVSFHLGALIVVAVLLRLRMRVIAVLAAGMLVTASGSGLVVVLLGLGALALSRHRHLLRRFVAPGLVGLVVVALTPLGQTLLSRTTEFQHSDSSSNLRATRGYADLWPLWRDSPAGQWLGAGAGAAQQHMADSGVLGLVAPTGTRLFYDYGIVGGALLLAVLVAAACRSWAGCLAVGLVASFATLQPATTNLILVLVLLLFVTLWSARQEDGGGGPPTEVLVLGDLRPAGGAR